MNLFSYCFTISGFILAVYYQSFLLLFYYQWFYINGLLSVVFVLRLTMSLFSYCFTISRFILAVYYQWFSLRGLI